MSTDNRTIFDLIGAVLRATSINEVSLQNRHPSLSADFKDAPGFRLGAWDNDGSGYLGVLAFDLLEGDQVDPTERVKIKLAFKIEPENGELVPVFEIYMMRNKASTEDRDEQRVFRISPKGAEFGVPVKGDIAASPAPAPTASSAPSFLEAPGKQTQAHLQGDGNFVLYRTNTDGSLGQAIFDTQSVLLRLAALETRWWQSPQSP